MTHKRGMKHKVFCHHHQNHHSKTFWWPTWPSCQCWSCLNLLQIHSLSALPAGEKEDTGWSLYNHYLGSSLFSPKSKIFQFWNPLSRWNYHNPWWINDYVHMILFLYISKSFEERGDMDEWSTCFRCSVPVHKNIRAKPILFSLGIVFFKQILAKSDPPP